MKIGCFGLGFVSSNKGCEALTYTFFSMLERLCPDEKIEVVNFEYCTDMGKVPESFPNMSFRSDRIKIKNPKAVISTIKKLKECDFFFDATYGDGFADIYGVRWNIVTDTIKQLVILSGTPLVLLPQTYGPFENKLMEKWAMHLIKKAEFVYSRDELSAKYIKDKFNYDIKVATDMAFKLPFDKSKYNITGTKKRIGINVSSLLWDSEWSKENHFGLSVDYRKYHETIIEKLINDDRYDVHIIPHVIDLKNPNSRENDYRVCLEMKEKYGDNIFIAPPFETPIEAKSYISNVDVFIGSRMHATIGAISSGVATIPFSYSRKFEGLFGNLGYEYVISAKEISTDEAIVLTSGWIENSDKLKKAGRNSVKKALNKLVPLEDDLKKLIGAK